MNVLRMILAIALVACGAHSAQAAPKNLDRATLQHLTSLQAGQTLTLDAFPVGPTQNASVILRRVQIYSDDAKIYLMDSTGKHELARSVRVFFRGHSADGSANVALSLDPDGNFVEGSGGGAEGSFVLGAEVAKDGTHTFSAKSLDSTLPSDFAFDFRCGNEKVNLDLRPSRDLATQLHQATLGSPAVSNPQARQAAFRPAVVGVDTDSLFMSRMFSNNSGNAVNWIASMFNGMNSMYEPDLNVQLLIGTTFIRIGSANDPYTGATDSPSDTRDLDIFGAYWKANESAVKRSFAILLSGQIASTPNSCSAAGIAWIDQYCQNGSTFGSDTVGSFSVTQVCTSLNIDPNGTFNARIVGHELGHNFGAYHTHCTNTSTGAAPVATNTIDVCYNGESGSGCYAGATSCPGGAGTIMSYCNINGCGQNQLHFHSTQINDVLLPLITANTPSCLNIANDDIFKDGFGG